MNPSIPDKLYFKIGEVARMADVATHVLRYWESEFNEIRPKRTKTGQRLYKKQDVEHILRVKTLLHGKGYTISGAKKYLKEARAGGVDGSQKFFVSSCKEIINTTGKLKKIRKELQEIQKILAS